MTQNIRVPRGSRSLTRAVLFGAALLMTGGLTAGCVLIEGPPIDRPERPTTHLPDIEDNAPAEYVPDGSAEDNLPIFSATLARVAEAQSETTGRVLVDELTAVGFDRDTMQVTFDRTPTDLVVDSVYVSARFGAECLVGQVDVASREVFVTVAPTVGPEADLCLIGNTRPIDW